MADNTVINPGAGGDTIATDELTTLNGAPISGVKVERVKPVYGVDGDATDVSMTNPLPVQIRGYGDTFYAYADNVAFAQNKSHLSIVNTGTKIVRVRKMFAIDLALAAVTGVAVRFDFKRATAHTAGTGITPEKADSASANLDAGITVKTGATVTEGNLLWPFTTNNDEVGATMAFPTNLIQQYGNLMMEGNEVRELTVRQNEGLTVKQITSTIVGSFGWIMVFTVE
jgi:hypothetical protein